MRISDWSSDVCSSDLGRYAGQRLLSLPPRTPSRRHPGDAAERQLPRHRGAGAHQSRAPRGGGAQRLQPTGVGAEQPARRRRPAADRLRSEEHTSELQSLMRTSYAVFCLKKKNTNINTTNINT